ncbi:MAG: helix-turn-helix transcriptional regulator [Clostridiales bacterium]|nr:helix-turn-helix transcriptional regulator [Clostridiales bacterium]
MQRQKDLNRDKNIIGERLRLLRKQEKISQRDLARRLQLLGVDIDRNVITRIETNKRYVSDIELKAIAKIFHVSYEYLLDDKE